MRLFRQVLSLLTFLPLLAACGPTESVNPIGSGERTSPAKTLGVATTDLPEDTKEQALLALEQDAYHRENRFLDAATPGHLFRSTRVDQAEIDQGLWSSEELFQLGAQLFQHTFTPEVGFGGKDLPVIARFHKGHRGGPDARKCAACHWRGGPAGAGDAADNAYLDGDGNSQSSALARNPPPLHGAGLVELLAREMSAALRRARDEALTFAKNNGYSVQVPLTAKGVSFGEITAHADGSVDTSLVSGVDGDLVVKPFGWKGTFATLRDTVEDALLVHHGMQSDFLASTAGPDRVGPHGGLDPDGDGVTSEIVEGQVTALTLFLAMQELPQEIPPEQQEFMPLFAEGIAMFESLGCATCHVPSLPLGSAVFELAARDSEASVLGGSRERGRETTAPTRRADRHARDPPLQRPEAPRHGLCACRSASGPWRRRQPVLDSPPLGNRPQPPLPPRRARPDARGRDLAARRRGPVLARRLRRVDRPRARPSPCVLDVPHAGPPRRRALTR